MLRSHRTEVTTIRLDPVVLGAIKRLGERWGVRNWHGEVNKSEVIRRCVIFTYFIMNGIDPTRASELVVKSIEEDLVELGEYGLDWILSQERKGKLK